MRDGLHRSASTKQLAVDDAALAGSEFGLPLWSASSNITCTKPQDSAPSSSVDMCPPLQLRHLSKQNSKLLRRKSSLKVLLSNASCFSEFS
jgi:hypothetical protein